MDLKRKILKGVLITKCRIHFSTNQFFEDALNTSIKNYINCFEKEIKKCLIKTLPSEKTIFYLFIDIQYILSTR